MSLVQQLIAAIRAAMGIVDQAQASITTARAHGDEALLLVQQATDGTSDPRPAEAIVRLQQANERLDSAAVELSAGTRALEHYISDGLGGETAATTPTTALQQPTSPPRKRPFKPMRSDRDKVEEIRPHVGKDYAVATLWDSNGNRILGPHSADDDGPAATVQWRAPWGEYPRLRRHVEAHAAARMKPGEEMAIYINIAPCSYSDGCKVNLRDIIPKGSTLWVHLVRPSGTVDVKPYRGTGRAYE